MTPLLDALRGYIREAIHKRAKRKKGKTPQQGDRQDPFEWIMNAIHLLLLGHLEPAQYNEPLMQNFIQQGGVDLCVEYLLGIHKYFLEEAETPEDEAVLNQRRVRTCISLLATFSDLPMLLPEVVAREAPEASILLFATSDFIDDMSIEIAGSSLRLLANVTSAAHESCLRVVLHPNSVSLLAQFDVLRPDVTVHHLRLFVNLIVDEFLDEPVPFSDEMEVEMAGACSRLVVTLIQVRNAGHPAKHVAGPEHVTQVDGSVASGRKNMPQCVENGWGKLSVVGMFVRGNRCRIAPDRQSVVISFTQHAFTADSAVPEPSANFLVLFFVEHAVSTGFCLLPAYGSACTVK